MDAHRSPRIGSARLPPRARTRGPGLLRWASDFATLLADDPDPGVRDEVALHRGTAPG